MPVFPHGELSIVPFQISSICAISCPKPIKDDREVELFISIPPDVLLGSHMIPLPSGVAILLSVVLGLTFLTISTLTDWDFALDTRY